jgi:hypothetical protein
MFFYGVVAGEVHFYRLWEIEIFRMCYSLWFIYSRCEMYGCLRALCKTISASFDSHGRLLLLTKVVSELEVQHVLGGAIDKSAGIKLDV